MSSPNAKIISVDYQPTATMRNWFKRRMGLYQAFTSNGQKMHLIMGDSHKKETKNMAKRLLGKAKLDLLFIDGDHRYEGVKADYKRYSSFVKKGGIIAFHDITRVPEVKKFWDELKINVPHASEINHHNGWGIGIINK